MRWFLSFLLLASWGWGGVDRFNFLADVNQDKKDELFRLEAFKKSEFGVFYQLKLYDSDGFLLWSGPKTTKEINPFMFGELIDGVGMPEGVVDINEDKKDELLAPYLQGDVSPTVYRVFGYKKKRVVLLFEKVLMLDKEKSSLKWIECKRECFENYKNRAWMVGIDAVLDKKEIVANIIAVNNDYNSKEARAILKFVKGGAKVKRWLEDFSESHIGYLAKISTKDHFNSKNKRLKLAIDILVNDRINFNKNRGDREDSFGGFDSPKDIKRLSKMRIVPINSSKDELINSIVYGTPLLFIKPKNDTLEIEILKYF